MDNMSQFRVASSRSLILQDSPEPEIVIVSIAVKIQAMFNKRITTPAVLNADEFFPDAGKFVDAWESIRDEALALTRSIDDIPKFHELLESQTRVSTEGYGNWRVFLPRAYGRDIEKNMEKCPTLAKLLREHPHVTTANISIIDPRKTIPAHKGPFKGIVRFSLGLSVPKTESGEPGVVLTLDGKEYRTGEGEWLLWDDTYEHAVRNETDEPRIVLLLDVFRAKMPLHLRFISWLTIKMVGSVVKKSDKFQV